jgi:CDP-2,3-bis-(O-geranylgeranyl)-sn-glycerol synthase
MFKYRNAQRRRLAFARTGWANSIRPLRPQLDSDQSGHRPPNLVAVEVDLLKLGHLESMLQTALVIKILVLLAVANGSPIVATRVLGEHLKFPVDGGLRFLDGRPVFGKSKTVRGIVIAAISTSLAAMLIGETWVLGLIVGLTSMAGDLISSFIKRRLGLAPSSRATGLDQVPEALVPTLVAMPYAGLTVVDVAAVVLLFFLGAIVLSNLFYRIGLRDRPH